jgi:hypothetical protein
MQQSPAPHESPGKAADKEDAPGSMSRFKALAARLFAVDTKAFAEARAKDEEERRARRSGP